MKEIKMPSGAILKIHLASFEDSRALYQAMLEEMKDIHIDAKTDLAYIYKQVAVYGFSSKRVEACVWKCFEKCIYQSAKGVELKIDKDTFEPAEARQDYLKACIEVMKENVSPFVKSLYADFESFLSEVINAPT